LEHICKQIYEKQSIDNIQYADGNQYTSTVLIQAIEKALAKAKAVKD
jgi:uncharacterized protein with FMN-binding domain